MGKSPRYEFALEYVEDVEAARAFYEGVLGLTVQRYHPTFVQFEGFAIAGGEPLGGRNETELYWSVEDAEAAHRELSEQAEVALPLTEMPYGKVFAVKDPAGRARFLLEWSRQRPSEAAP